MPDALASVGVDAATVTDVVLTHLHYDHVVVGALPGRPVPPPGEGDGLRHRAAHGPPRRVGAFTPGHVAALVHEVFAQRVVFHDGDVTLAPGLSLHLLGGHTAGTQVVRVRTAGGWLVLASDASHYYENMETGRPFPIVHDVGDMLDGYDRLLALASERRPSCPATTRSCCSATRSPGRRSRASRSASTRAASAPDRPFRRRAQERGQPGVGVRGSARSSRAILR